MSADATTIVNASISVFRHGVFYDTLRWVMDRWGDTCHLTGIARLNAAPVAPRREDTGLQK